MINRLGSRLPSWVTKRVPGDDDDSVQHLPTDIEWGRPKTKEQVDKEIFFTAVEKIKVDIGHIVQATADVERINEQAQKATTTLREHELSRKLRKTIDTTNKQAKAAKNMMGELKKENEKLKIKGELKASDVRLRENLLNTLTRKFIDEMKAYQAAQQKYKADIERKMKRQVRVIKPDATDEEVDIIANSEGGRDEFFQQMVLAGGVNEEITLITARIEDKYQDIKALEQSVAELHQMFLDFALIVEQQGEVLNNIELQVRQAVDHVEDGNKEIFQSIELQKSIRKKQLYIALVVVVIIVVIVLATQPWKKSAQ